MPSLPWLILFLPLAAAAAILLATRRYRGLSAGLSLGAVGAGFGLSLWLFVAYLAGDGAANETNFTWLTAGTLQVPFGVRLDSLSLLMLLVVTGVGSLIHWFSRAYLANDPGWSRYFAGLSLFTFSMLGIVLATNFVQMFIFWELVGLSSYLLIGFWYERPAAAAAARKAFLVNRLGDFGFLIGILMIQNVTGTLVFSEIKDLLADDPAALGPGATAIGLLLFCGAVGKSAQFPLHVWLPDAMEGPTPVSALIHAATMVAAGVYLLCRIFPVFTPEALLVIAWLGALTSLLAALIALQQNDIKRILAYSTLSQLGYMVMAVGVHAPLSAMFHLTTHACFKALLFLGAGSVICALHHRQDIWEMGGLRRRMPTTRGTFLIGTLALCGLPPLSGFFSKDAVLAASADTALGGNLALFFIGILVAVLTTWYMFRLYFAVFEGEGRSDAAREAVESPATMIRPLIILALASVAAGWLPIESFVAQTAGFASPVDSAYTLLAVAFSILAFMFGLSVAVTLYFRASNDPFAQFSGFLSRTLRHRFYLDEIYEHLINVTHEALSRLAFWIDRHLIAGLAIRGLTGVTDLTGRALRLLQTGNLRAYTFLFALGTALILYFVLRPWVF